MVVVADTSPLNYLIQIDCDVLLPHLYDRIIVPAGVMQEMRHPGAPGAVQVWLTRLPAWVEGASTVDNPDASLLSLGLGEREAIQLAEERHADLLLIDERRGRAEAKRRGLRMVGTLGVLWQAGELKLIDAEFAYRRLLAETSFRNSAALHERFMGLIRPS